MLGLPHGGHLKRRPVKQRNSSVDSDLASFRIEALGSGCGRRQPRDSAS